MPLDAAKKEPTSTQPQASARLLSLIERVERLEEEKKAIANDIKDIYGEAKSAGFDVKVMRQMIKERAADPNDLEEFQALCEVYRASLGMLHGTPLGKHALQRLMPDPPKPPAEPPAEPPAAGEAATAPRKPKKDPAQGAALSPDEVAGLDDGLPAGEPEVSPEEARAAGAAAAREGKPVTANPYPFGATRAAFDEGWCSEVGGDGMDIPSAWRRTPKKKPDETKGEAA